MKYLLVICAFSLTLTSALASEITCKSEPFASCKTEEMCVDFFDVPGVDLDMLEGACFSMEGEFSEAGCNREGVVLSCVNSANFMMPLMHFLGDISTEDANLMCSALGGKPCSK